MALIRSLQKLTLNFNWHSVPHVNNYLTRNDYNFSLHQTSIGISIQCSYFHTFTSTLSRKIELKIIFIHSTSWGFSFCYVCVDFKWGARTTFLLNDRRKGLVHIHVPLHFSENYHQFSITMEKITNFSIDFVTFFISTLSLLYSAPSSKN